MENTNIFILIFGLCVIPKEVFTGWTKCEVCEYIPRPRTCFKCQAFNHSSNAYRSDTGICVRCGEVCHSQQWDKPKCRNCGEDHPASSIDCFYYKLEQETITIKTREKISYSEAKKIATERMVKPQKSYAATVNINKQEIMNQNRSKAIANKQSMNNTNMSQNVTNLNEITITSAPKTTSANNPPRRTPKNATATNSKPYTHNTINIAGTHANNKVSQLSVEPKDKAEQNNTISTIISQREEHDTLQTTTSSQDRDGSVLDDA